MPNSKWQMVGGICSLFAVHFLLLPHALADQDRLFALLEKVEASYEVVHDYTAVFRRHERLDGEIRTPQTVLLKFQKPFKVYLRWISEPHEGREAIFVKEAYDDRVLIREPRGIARFFTLLLEPGSERILRESRYPFTEIGIGRLIQRVIREARRAWARKELKLLELGTHTVEGREVLWVEGTLPRDPEVGYSYHRIELAIDREIWLPVRASLYDRNNQLVGEYTYSDLRLNPGLGPADFDPSNPAYNFPRWRINLASGE